MIIGAKHEKMDPVAMEEQSKWVPGGPYLYCPDGSHYSIWDDQQVLMDSVIKIIGIIDQNKF